MGLIGLVAGLGTFCVLLWCCAIYALAIFVGLSAGWWSLNHGMGLGCIIVGLVAGSSIHWLCRITAASSNALLRWIAIVVFVLPAAYAGFQISSEFVQPLHPAWRWMFEVASTIAVAVTALARLAPDAQ